MNRSLASRAGAAIVAAGFCLGLSGAASVAGDADADHLHHQLAAITVDKDPDAQAEQGVDALFKGNYSDAFPLLEKAAGQGSARAALALSSALYIGLGRPADFTLAFNWAQMAADAGDPTGQRLLAWFTLTGTGTSKNPRLANRRFEAAADQNDVWAQYSLGRLSESGAAGIKRDLEQAVSWYELAAENGLPMAQWRLGELLLAGEGTNQDKNRGVGLLRRAAEAGVVPAISSLARQMFKGEGTVQNYDEALKNYRIAAQLGQADAQNMAGYMLHNGIGVKQDPKAASSFYIKAGAKGHPQALHNLALLYRDGQGVKADAEIAHGLFNRAGANGLSEAIHERQKLEVRMSARQLQTAQRFASSWRETWTLDTMRLKSSGTGFFISPGGAVVTNHHVVDGCDAVAVRIGDQIREAGVSFAVEKVDLALIHLQPEEGVQSEFRVAHIAPQEDLFLGERVTVFGWPFSGVLSSDGVVTTGTLSAKSGVRDNPDFMQISAPVQPGNSGGPVMNEAGYIIGVVRARLEKLGDKVAQNVNFAVKHSVLTDLLDRHGKGYSTVRASDWRSLSTRQLAQVGEKISAQILCYEYKFGK